MSIELLTKADIQELILKVSCMETKLDNINATLSANENKTLGSPEIMARLKISPAVFHTRRTELTRYGMYKDGQWKMKAFDLDKYIDDKKNN